MSYAIAALSAFLLTALLTPMVIKLARRYECYDLPGRRRFHRVKTPRWGGIAFFLGVLPVLAYLALSDRRMIAYLAASVVIVAAGIIDDRRSLGWKGKMSAIAVAVSIIVFGGDLSVQRLAVFPDLSIQELGMLSIPFTYFGVVGVTNAMNMIDGLNGLSTGISLIAFLFFGLAALLVGNTPLAVMSFAFCGAMGGFLLYNFPRARIFMGDSGSMFLGFSLAVGAVLLTQDARYPVDPFFPFAVLVLPIFDAVRIMVVRIVKGRSPFAADKGHLHHLIHRNRISSLNTVILMWGLSFLAGAGALMLLKSTSGAFLAAVTAFMLGLAAMADSLGRKRTMKVRGGGAMRDVDVSTAHAPAMVTGQRARYEAPALSMPDLAEEKRRK